MKKILAVILTLVMAFAIVMPANAALVYIYDVKSEYYTENPVWYGSGLAGYDNASTRYTNVEGTATWQPLIETPATYKVSIWNVGHSTNADNLNGEIKHKNGITPFTIQHKGTADGFVDLGEFEFETGNNGYVQVKAGNTGDGFTRVSSIKLELAADENGNTSYDADVPKTGEDIYPETSYRELVKKDVELPEIAENATVIYASPDGNGDGTEAAPLSLKGAQEKVREIIKGGYPEGGIGVYLKGGTYKLDDTFRFTSEDSGQEGKPVIWRAVPGEEVIFTAGTVVSKENVSVLEDTAVLKKIPTDARGKVYVADLAKEGIENIPDMDLKNSVPYVLILGDQLGKTARWPNSGYGITGELVDNATREAGGERKKGFTYDIDNPAVLRWADAKEAWLNGYWLTPYTIDYAKIALLDPNRMLMAGKHDNSLGAYSDARYYVENLIEELDDEGEWFLDTKVSKLYFVPFEGKEEDTVTFLHKNFNLVEFKDATNVVLRGVRLIGGGQHGAYFAPESSNCALIGKEIKNVSGNGAFIQGYNNIVRDMDISYTGAEGVLINGGEEYKMIYGNNVAENNSVHDVGTGGGQKHGIKVIGCGNKAIHNHIYNILTHGIDGSGMAHTYEYNIVERTNLEMGDTGAIYFHNPSMGYGTKIRYNIVIDSVGILPIVGLTGDGAMGIYIDNGGSGFEVTHNICINMDEPAFFSNGGRDNKFINNIAINCDEPYVMNETPGVSARISNKGNIMKYPIKEEPLKSMFPNLATIETEFPDSYGYSKHLEVRKNISYNGGISSIQNVTKHGGIAEAIIDADIPEGQNYEDPFNINFDEIRKYIPDFEDIPVSEIGVYTGGERTNTTEINFDNKADAFELSYPKNGATNVDPDVKFTWSYPKAGIQDAEIFIADNEEFQNVADYNRSTRTDYETTLGYGKTYYWRVKAYPMLGREPRWNEGGIYSFTTMTAEDKLAGELAAAEHILEATTVGDGANEFSAEARQALESAVATAKAAQDAKSCEAAIDELSEATNKYVASRKADDKTNILVFDNYELDKIGQRPLGMFMRSYFPLDGQVQKDPTNEKNQMVRFNDREDTHHYASRWFINQDRFVSVATSVIAGQKDASFSISLLKTGANPVESGTINDSAAKVVFAADGNIYADLEKTKLLMPYEANTAYDVLIELDLQNKVYDVSINGNKMAEAVPMYNKSVTEVNQIVYDTLDGTADSGSYVGTFFFDNTIVRGEKKSTGRNPYLLDLTINGETIYDFEPGKFVYEVDSLDGEIGWKTSDDAKVKIKECDGLKVVTVISGDLSEFAVYYIKK